MSSARLMYAASGHDADMLYATHFYADDPFIWWEARGKTHVALSPLEIDRAKPIASVDQIHGLGEFLSTQARSHAAPEVIRGIADKFRVRSFLVPEQFPAGLLEKLRAQGLKITVSEQPFFPPTRLQNERRDQGFNPRPACGGNRSTPRHGCPQEKPGQ